MNKIIPFKKEIEFKTNISEIISIALDHKLEIKENKVVGNLIVSGSYKENELSLDEKEFKNEIPVSIEMSKHYDIKNMTIEIEDFYYEIINNKLLTKIEIKLDNLKEMPLVVKDDVKKIKLETNKVEEIQESRNSIMDNNDNKENYSTYHVLIIKENDTIDNILLKYNITKELLEQYNEINNINVGDKIIIPAIYD